MKSERVTIHMNAIEQFFPVMLFIIGIFNLFLTYYCSQNNNW